MKRRNEDGAYHIIFQELLKEDSKGFRDYIRIDKARHDEFVERLRPYLTKEDTIMRECIKPEEMCCLMLRYLASVESHLDRWNINLE